MRIDTTMKSFSAWIVEQKYHPLQPPGSVMNRGMDAEDFPSKTNVGLGPFQSSMLTTGQGLAPFDSGRTPGPPTPKRATTPVPKAAPPAAPVPKAAPPAAPPVKPTVSGPSAGAPVSKAAPKPAAQPTDPKNVGFGSAFLQDVARQTGRYSAASKQYLGVAASIMPQFKNHLILAWQRTVGPAEQQLAQVNAKVKALLAQAGVHWAGPGQRQTESSTMSFSEWLVMEGIRVNYKTFEEMKAAIKGYMDAIETFHQQVMNAVSKRGMQQKAQYLQQYFQQKVSAEKRHMAAAYKQLDDMIANLMSKNNMAKFSYKGQGEWVPANQGAIQKHDQMQSSSKKALGVGFTRRPATSPAPAPAPVAPARR